MNDMAMLIGLGIHILLIAIWLHLLTKCMWKQKEFRIGNKWVWGLFMVFTFIFGSIIYYIIEYRNYFGKIENESDDMIHSTEIKNETLPLKELTFWQRVEGVLLSPTDTFKEIAKNATRLQGFAVVLLASIVSVIGSGILYIQGYYGDMDLLIDVGWNVRDIIGWFVGSAILTFIGGLLGGKGKFKNILPVIGFAQVTYIIYGILWIPILLGGGLISELTDSLYFIEIITLTLFSIWFVLLCVVGIKEAHNFSYIKSIITVVPYGVIGYVILMIVSL